MKKLLFFVSVIGLVGCNTYTVKNETAGQITVAGSNVEAGACVEFSDSFFGLFGDFPITITDEEDSKLSDDAKEEYDVANYVVKADKSVEKVDEACEKKAEEVEKEEASVEGETPATTKTPTTEETSATTKTPTTEAPVPPTPGRSDDPGTD